MRLIQFLDSKGRSRVGRVADDGSTVAAMVGSASMYELAHAAITSNATLDEVAAKSRYEVPESYGKVLESKRVLAPLTHVDPHRCMVSGTGLTHLGSAATRDAMHEKTKS